MDYKTNSVFLANLLQTQQLDIYILMVIVIGEDWQNESSESGSFQNQVKDSSILRLPPRTKINVS